jgi:transposase
VRPRSIELRREREISRWRLHLVKHRATLKNRVHSTLITFGHQCHMSDLFGVAGRRLLKELEMPEPWRSHVDASLQLIDDLEARIKQIAKELRRSGADHRFIPILMTAPHARPSAALSLGSDGEAERACPQATDVPGAS